jgi:hypothetical protein
MEEEKSDCLTVEALIQGLEAAARDGGSGKMEVWARIMTPNDKMTEVGPQGARLCLVTSPIAIMTALNEEGNPNLELGSMVMLAVWPVDSL